MHFSLPISIALLLGSYAAGAPVTPPEEGEITDGSGGQGGSPGQHGNTPGSQNSGGSSSNPSIGLGLNRQHRGEIGTADLGHYATPDRFDQNPSSGHWGISHPVVGHGQIGPNLAVTPMTSSRTTQHPAGDYGFSNYKPGSHLEVAGGPRFIPETGFQPSGSGAGSLQQTEKGYRDLVRANRQEVANRQGGPPQTPHNPGYNPQVLPAVHWQPSGGASTSGPPSQHYPGPGGLPPAPHSLPQRPPPPMRQSTAPVYPVQPPHPPVRHPTLPAPGPAGLPLNPYSQLPPQAHIQQMHQRPSGGLPPPPPHLPAPPHMGLPPPPAHLPAPPHMMQQNPHGLPMRPPSSLPPPPAGLPARPPSRGGGGRGRGTARYNPYQRGPGGAGSGT